MIRVAGKGGFKRHKVKRGETMASVANRYGISVSTLKACNNLSGKRSLHAGQRLKIPIRTARYAKASSGKQPDREKMAAGDNGRIIRYKVKKGDSLSSLAQRFNTTQAEIKRVNRIKTNSIQAGRIIKIGSPAGASETEADHPENSEKKAAANKKSVQQDVTGEPSGSVYRVKKGDSLDRIARKNKVSLARLLELNKLGMSDNIHPGQTIVLK